MPRAAARFRQADLARAIRAATACGLTIGRVEIDPMTGRIMIETKEPGAPAPAALGSMAEWRARRGKS